MKRVVSLVLSMLLVLPMVLSVHAESSIPHYEKNFVIRNGLSYHIDKASAMEVEKINGGSLETEYDRNNKILYGMEETDLWYDTSLLDDDVIMFLYFNEEGLLNGIHYFLASVYEKVVPALISKYGTPLFDENNISPFESNAFVEYNAWKGIGQNVSLREYKGWLIEYADCYVLIEAVDSTKASTLTYTFISHEEMEAKIQELKDKKDRIQQSINNDL